MTTPYFRRCIQIRAEDAPTVQAGLRGETIDFPGILSYDEYRHRRATWNIQRQTEGLDARWYVGAAVMLVPEPWLIVAGRVLRPKTTVGYATFPRYMGVDPGEGGDDSAWCVIDQHGILELISYPTPDTNKVVGQTIMLAKAMNVAWESITFDRGGGGKEHSDRMRAMGYKVRNVGFGEPVKVEPKRGIRTFPERVEVTEEKYASKNRRSEMAWDIRMLLECSENDSGEVVQLRKGGFHIPAGEKYDELRRQMKLIPITYDAEGRFHLLPKQDPKDPDNEQTLRYIIGRSPDQFDAFGLACFGMNHKPVRQMAGVS